MSKISSCAWPFRDPDQRFVTNKNLALMSYLNDPSSNSELRLEAVRGYYELEMYDDAWDELKEVEKVFSPDSINSADKDSLLS